jgi:hypothetical protein
MQFKPTFMFWTNSNLVFTVVFFQDQKDYTLVEQTEDTIYIRARFTKKGYYKLTIFSKFGEPQKFTEALILLIFNSNESETTSAFPLTN